MGSVWNLIGVGAWLIVLAYLIFIVQNIRHRHIKMIINEQKTFKWRVLFTDCLMIIVFLVGFCLMSYETFFSKVEVTNHQLVSVKYSTEPLVLQTNGDTGYFVTVEQGAGRTPIQTYTFWTAGQRNQVKSIHASIATGKKPISIGAKVYRFSDTLIKKADEKYNQAFAAKAVATYKKGFWNGLGMRVGHNALDYTMIRVPSSLFVSQEDPTKP